jgi:hypothetical protein
LQRSINESFTNQRGTIMQTTTRLRLLLATACTVLAAATPADAALIQQVYSGTVVYGYDNLGIFGAGPDLTGLAYTATYLIDDSKGTESNYVYDDGAGTYYYSVDQIVGGIGYNGTSNPVSAKLTIAGVTIALGSDYYGSAYKSDYSPMSSSIDGFSTQVFDYVISPDGSTYASYSLYNYAYVNSARITSSDLRTPDAFTPLSGYGSGTYQNYDYATGTQAYAQFDATSFTSSPAAVPEPASWALMIGGFGIAGGALRRRRSTMAATPARHPATA